MISSTATNICTGTTKRGTRCQNPALPGSVWCWWHAPDKADDRREARSKGGRARHGRRLGTTNSGELVTISDLGDVVKLLERTINDALSLENSLSRANTIARLASVLCGIYQVSELEARITVLEVAVR